LETVGKLNEHEFHQDDWHQNTGIPSYMVPCCLLDPI